MFVGAVDVCRCSRCARKECLSVCSCTTCASSGWHRLVAQDVAVLRRLDVAVLRKIRAYYAPRLFASLASVCLSLSCLCVSLPLERPAAPAQHCCLHHSLAPGTHIRNPLGRGDVGKLMAAYSEQEQAKQVAAHIQQDLAPQKPPLPHLSRNTTTRPGGSLGSLINPLGGWSANHFRASTLPLFLALVLLLPSLRATMGGRVGECEAALRHTTQVSTRVLSDTGRVMSDLLSRGVSCLTFSRCRLSVPSPDGHVYPSLAAVSSFLSIVCPSLLVYGVCGVCAVCGGVWRLMCVVSVCVSGVGYRLVARQSGGT